MMGNYEREVSSAVAAVRAAAGVTRSVQAALVTADTLEKKDKSPVTVADFASQAVVCHLLGQAFPADPVVGEESAHALGQETNAALCEQVVRRASVVEGLNGRAAVLDAIDRGGFDPASPGTLLGTLSGTLPGGARRYWALDPIDGTKGFLRREQYAIALALIADGQVVVGVLGCPNLGPLSGGDPHGSQGSPWGLGVPGVGVVTVAVRGAGCFTLPLDGEGVDGEAVRVSDVDDASGARFCESVESGHSDQGWSAAIARKLGITAEPVRMDSQAKYAVVARGEASIYLRLPTRADYRERIWDHAAGALVVEEAGGTVTDIDGRPLDFSKGRALSANRGVIATNGRVHGAVTAAVRDRVQGEC